MSTTILLLSMTQAFAASPCARGEAHSLRCSDGHRVVCSTRCCLIENMKMECATPMASSLGLEPETTSWIFPSDDSANLPLMSELQDTDVTCEVL